jgi:Na+-transporting methylmalonyl-CoA/oxaloacetate decarboxylase gamma subunit
MNPIELPLLNADSVALAARQAEVWLSPFAGRPGLSKIMMFQGTGLVVVLLALGAIAVICWVMSTTIQALVRVRKPATAGATAAHASAAAFSPAADPMANPELVAVITAAAAAALDRELGHVRIENISEENHSWRVEGRAAIHTSHRLR